MGSQCNAVLPIVVYNSNINYAEVLLMGPTMKLDTFTIENVHDVEFEVLDLRASGSLKLVVTYCTVSGYPASPQQLRQINDNDALVRDLYFRYN